MNTHPAPLDRARRRTIARTCGVVRYAMAVAVTTLIAAAGLGATALASTPQPSTWNFTQAKVPQAQELGKLGSGATVAVVDTWIDGTHPDLRGRLIGHAYCVGGRGSCQPDRHRPDRCDHGTHVAGTVASTRYGVAPRVGVLAIQVLAEDGSDCGGTTGDVAAGIRFATSRAVDVINLSLGTLVPGLFQSGEVTAAVRDAARAGIVVVFAAGNNTIPLTDNYGSDALLVAATGPNGGVASYSNRGSTVALAAPGGDAGLASCGERNCVLSTAPEGGYKLMQGTSMAAPHVSGTAALLVAQAPARGRASIVNALLSTARPLSGTRHGLLDASAALRVHKPQPAPAKRTQAAAPTRAVPQTPAAASPATVRQRTTSARDATTTTTPPPGASPTLEAPQKADATSAPSSTDGGPSAGSAPAAGGAPPAAIVLAGIALAGVAGWLLVVSNRRLRDDED